MSRNTLVHSHEHAPASDAGSAQPLRALRPTRLERGAVPVASLEELAASLPISPDDVPLEVEDLASHFLFEATQSSMPSSAPPPEVPPAALSADATLREALLEPSDREEEQLREFERIWKHIISRELSSTEL